MAKVTPNKRAPKPKSSAGSSGGKQMSLLSFFKPASAPQKHNLSSSPLKSKSAVPASDKENDISMLDAVTDTPLTSESDAPVLSEKKPHHENMHSSPVKPQTAKKSNLGQDSAVKSTESSQKNASSPVRKENTSCTEEEVTIIDDEITIVDEDAAESSENAKKTEVKKNTKSESVSKRGRAKVNVSYVESDAEEEDAPVVRKRRRVVESDDEDEDAFVPDDNAEDEDDHMSDFVVESEASAAEEEEEENSEDEIGPKRKSTAKASYSKSKSPQASPATRNTSSTSSLGSKFSANSSYVASQLPANSAKKALKPAAKKSFEKENEERYQWLVEVRDAEKRPVDHPEYDSRTLYIPSSAWAKFTAFEKQYWEIKSKMWDTVVFFKKGKFYELYENDAMIANTKFDLKIAGGGRANMKLAGVPEMSFEYWAKEFISIGYKVAKVDQKETMLAKEMRGGGSKEEKIIKRELAGILTGGTLTDMDMITDDMATYCMAIKEATATNGAKIFGVCFVDTATSEMNFIELQDDEECTKLDTLITQIRPKEVLCEKHNLCSAAVKIIKYSAHSRHQIWNHLNPYSEFWDYDTAVEKLVHSKYYEAADLDDFSKYPAILLQFKDHHETAFSAFGALLWYLKELKLDEGIMTLKNMQEYHISKSAASHMLLDGITLNNLEILSNTFDGGDKGTLLKLLNRAITPFGKRTMKQWVLYPLMNTAHINSRYDAVEFLMHQQPEMRVQLEAALNKLPDLERLIARVHSKTLRFKDFVKVLEGFETVGKIFRILEAHDLSKAGAIDACKTRFPEEMHAVIASWEDAFDRQAAQSNEVVPAEGVDEEFDASSATIRDLEAQLNDHLRAYKKQFKSHEICFRDSGKELYLIEMPIKIKNIPHDWQQMAATSKVKRYWSPEVRKLVRALMEQKELHKTVCAEIVSKLYARFDVNYDTWVHVIKAVASLDCLVALARTSETMGFPSCRPTFDSVQAAGSVQFDELRHPCFVGAGEFIPNDVALGNGHARFGLLTGANAAGKSTLMRTTALAVMLCQIGCFVPARSARLAPVDRIMTRLGANDNIIQGKSTFFVELSETKKILSNATPNSLVILDELGRGGSSSDGYAIAEAVLHQLASHVQPLGFFATHYGSLGLSFVNHPQIRPLRMGIVADGASRNITFLYKLEEGTAPGSFGMSVAAMCGIDAGIVDAAERAAHAYEQTSQLRQQHDASRAGSLSLGLQSDVVWLAQRPGELEKEILRYGETEKQSALSSIFHMIESL